MNACVSFATAPVDCSATPVLPRVPTIGGVGLVLPDDGLDVDASLRAIERAYTEQALARAGGNLAQAARLLGLKRTTLIERLRAWDSAVSPRRRRT